ncbi:MAG: aminopeptidase, partial [Verrucomicrobiales bacterium]|nr:aminopeptidase [Verrucomicrobiales bacterium]
MNGMMRLGEVDGMLVSVAIHCKSLTHRGWAIAVAILAATLSGCRTANYYRQAVGGQWEILRKARPIDTVRNDPKTSADLKKRLDTVESVRAFAATHLGLDATRQYDRYTDLGRPYVVW